MLRYQEHIITLRIHIQTRDIAALAVSVPLYMDNIIYYLYTQLFRMRLHNTGYLFTINNQACVPANPEVGRKISYM
jgi:hypothetical protein